MEHYNNEYYVEAVRDKKIVNGEVYYLIKWDGYPESSDTWEPKENLENIQNLIQDFEKKQINNKSKNKNKKNISIQKEIDLNEECSISPEKKKKKSKSHFNKNNSKDKMNFNELICLDLDGFVPETILNVKKGEKEILCLVSFYERSDGISRDNCWIPTKIISEKFPQILIKFYESKIKFVEKK